MEPCRAFIRGKCRFGDACRFLHRPVLGQDVQGGWGVGVDGAAASERWGISWHVSDLPACSEEDLIEAFQAIMCLPSGCTFTAHLHGRGGNAAAPYAFVSVEGGSSAGDGGVKEDAQILADGVRICGKKCSVRRRKSSRKARLDDLDRCRTAKEAAIRKATERRPAWDHEMLSQFPRRASTLDKARDNPRLCRSLTSPKPAVRIHTKKISEDYIHNSHHVACVHDDHTCRSQRLGSFPPSWSSLRSSTSSVSCQPRRPAPSGWSGSGTPRHSASRSCGRLWRHTS